MKKKKYLLRAVKILSLFLALALCAGFLQEFVLCRGDHNRERIKGFQLEDKNSVDVVLIGASEVYYGFSSCYAYEKFGFTSYPFAIQSNIVTNFKSQLQTVLEAQNPKLIVVEVNGALYGNDDPLYKEANFRNYADNIPISATKLRAVESYSRENPDFDKMSCYFPIIKYHSVWNDFPKGLKWNASIIQDRIRGCSLLKGTKTKTVVYKPDEKVFNGELKNNSEKNKLAKRSEESLRDFLEYCKSENIENIVFARFPHIITKKSVSRFKRCNSAAAIIEEYGYDFLNFEKDFDKTGLDMNTDFCHPEHLNIYGQQKFTAYFSKILQRNYSIEKSDLTEAQKQKWEQSVSCYNAFDKYARELTEKGKVKEVAENYKDMEKMKDYM